MTSNQPKPMVPVANKPTAQHILDLLARHGIEDAIMTVAFLPQLIRNHFGDGSSLGMRIEYSVEETPLGTAGSVKNAESVLDDTFLVISGDSLTDFDLTAIIDFHRRREALVTIALKSVENPLEFGVVIVDEEGRIERFLEKPGWGQVFSDTSTPVYTCWSRRCSTTFLLVNRTISVISSSPGSSRSGSFCTVCCAWDTGRTWARSSSIFRPTVTRWTARSTCRCPASVCGAMSGLVKESVSTRSIT